jgi:hypothetical protein
MIVTCLMRVWVYSYLTLRYSSTINAPHVNKSGNMANGPRPNGRKPKAQIIMGLEVRAFRRKTNENIISPIVNSDRVFLYMLMYVSNRKIKSVTLIVETIIFAV